jgi:TolA-binding protein
VAVAQLETGDASSAIRNLLRIADARPKHPRADNALYYSAVGRMGMTEYREAAEALKLLLARYPAGDAVPDALLKLAECRQREKQEADARALYTKLVASYPGTTAAAEAQDRLAQFKASTP